jgi:hypothetical protein
MALSFFSDYEPFSGLLSFLLRYSYCEFPVADARYRMTALSYQSRKPKQEKGDHH